MIFGGCGELLAEREPRSVEWTEMVCPSDDVVSAEISMAPTSRAYQVVVRICDDDEPERSTSMTR